MGWTEKGMYIFKNGRQTVVSIGGEKAETKLLTIGCIQLELREWQSDYKSIGKKERYSEEEIQIHTTFIKFFIDTYDK